jgi:hypothetical protein
MTAYAMSITIPMLGHPMPMRSAVVVNLLERGRGPAVHNAWRHPGCRVGRAAETDQGASGKHCGEQYVSHDYLP